MAVKYQILTAGWRTPTVKKHRRVPVFISVHAHIEWVQVACHCHGTEGAPFNLLNIYITVASL